MDFKSIAPHARPVYTWFWNTEITRDGIKRQIDEMYESGIRGFYVLGEPESFRPTVRRTHLSPEYLSDEYLDLLYYAYELSEERGMEFWLYNEGGFPSGMVCGKINEQRPHLAKKYIGFRKVLLRAGEKYKKPTDTVAAYADGEAVTEGYSASGDTELTEYYVYPDRTINSDIAKRETTDLFLELTHEKMLRRFGSTMGEKVTIMFDDEAHMGSWTEGLDELFMERYGYEIYPYLQFITGEREPRSYEEYKAVSDYGMLAGELTVNNYFLPMREWLNSHGMLSVGHLDNESSTKRLRGVMYGNVMNAFRAFDVPGVDVIRSQIAYPDAVGEPCNEGNRFFPRYASSAARQMGKRLALSESFAVRGADISFEEMRYIINYQAVRGINIFNFMTVSYDRKTPMCLQYRPNFNIDNPTMDMLAPINEYTGRLCDILQRGEAVIHTALYYPARSSLAMGGRGDAVSDAYDRLGAFLEDNGVSFDIIDEDLVRCCRLEDGALVGEHVSYLNVFIPEGCFLEPSDVMEKLEAVGKNIVPDIARSNKYIQARRLHFEGSDEGYLICNLSGERVSDIVRIKSERYPYCVDLSSGDKYEPEFKREGDEILLNLELTRGNACFIYLSEREEGIPKMPSYECVSELEKLSSYVSRRYLLDKECGPINIYPERVCREDALAPFDKDLSGEITYEAEINTELLEAYLDLGEVCGAARIFLNGKKICEAVMPPYIAKLGAVKCGDQLKIVLANTIANACNSTDYFDVMDIRDVGCYHEKMKLEEEKAEQSGIFGPIRILKRNQD